MSQYHFAQAAGKLAEGLWPPNPAALLSAGKHVIAGGLFAALPGLARAGGAGGGAGGGSLSRGGSAAALARGTQGERPGAEIHIYFDAPGFSATNPTVQRVVMGAAQYYQERYGPNAKVNVHRSGR
jgi:hypothetical protein